MLRVRSSTSLFTALELCRTCWRWVVSSVISVCISFVYFPCAIVGFVDISRDLFDVDSVIAIYYG